MVFKKEKRKWVSLGLVRSGSHSVVRRFNSLASRLKGTQVIWQGRVEARMPTGREALDGRHWDWGASWIRWPKPKRSWAILAPRPTSVTANFSRHPPARLIPPTPSHLQPLSSFKEVPECLDFRIFQIYPFPKISTFSKKNCDHYQSSDFN
jgi:hypothetical protein